MALARNLLHRRLHSLLEPQYVAFVSHVIHSNHPHCHKIPHSHHRPFASSSQSLAESDQTHALKSLHSIFQRHSVWRSDPKNEKPGETSKQGEAVGLPEKTGDKKKKKKKPQKKLSKSSEPRVKFVEEEEEEGEVVKETLQGKPEQGEAVSLSEETEQKKSEVQGVEDKKKKPKKKLKKPIKFIEEEEEEKVVEGEQTNKPEPKRLYDLFGQGEKSNEANPRILSRGIILVEKHNEVKQREPVSLKKLSLDMETFLSYLYKEGYFSEANFVKGKNFDLSWFDIKYARYYTLSAAQKFGKDKQEISKWLSGSDLKLVAMFGCPSDSKSQVFASKRLRYYFKIQEDTVCSKCVLRDSCKFVNQSVWRTDNNNLDLAMAMKVICSYAMSIVHPQLVVPDKVNYSVNRLLKEVLKLSQTF